MERTTEVPKLDFSSLTPQRIMHLPDAVFQHMAEKVIEVQRADRKENQILYYQPASERAMQVHLSNAKFIGISGGNRSSKTETILAELTALATGMFPIKLHDLMMEKFRGPINVRIVIESFKTVLHPIMLPKLQWWKWSGADEPGGDRGHWGWVPRTCLMDGSWLKSWSEKNAMLTILCRDPDNIDKVIGESTFQFMCLRGDQRVLMFDGIWKEIKDIKEGDRLHHPYKNQNHMTRVIKTYHYHDAPMFRIRCQGGREIVCTDNHKHPMIDGSLKITKDLNLGDIIQTNQYENIAGAKTLELWQSGWLGIMIGDGYIKHKQASFTASKSGRVMNDLPEMPPNTRLVPYRKKDNTDIFDWNVSLIKGRKNNPLVCFLKQIGLWGKGSKDKFIPDIVFSQPPYSRTYFLKHLWNTDGTINQKGRQACYTTISRRLAYDVKYLLWGLGIKASVGDVNGHCGFTGKDIIAYHTVVSGGAYDRFMAAISLKRFKDIKTTKYGIVGKIKDITQVDNSDSYCVEVDADDHLHRQHSLLFLTPIINI